MGEQVMNDTIIAFLVRTVSNNLNKTGKRINSR